MLRCAHLLRALLALAVVATANAVPNEVGSAPPTGSEGLKVASNAHEEPTAVPNLNKATIALARLEAKLGSERQLRATAQEQLLQQTNGIEAEERSMSDLQTSTRQMEKNAQKKEKLLKDTYRLLRGPVAEEASAQGLPKPKSINTQLTTEKEQAKIKEASSVSKRLTKAQSLAKHGKDQVASNENELKKLNKEFKTAQKQVHQQATQLKKLKAQEQELEELRKAREGKALRKRQGEDEVVNTRKKKATQISLKVSEADEEITALQKQLRELKKEEREGEDKVIHQKAATSWRGESVKARQQNVKAEEDQSNRQKLQVDDLRHYISTGLALANGSSEAVDEKQAHLQMTNILVLESTKRQATKEVSIRLRQVQAKANATQSLLEEAQNRTVQEANEARESIQRLQQNRLIKARAKKDMITQLPQVMQQKHKREEARREQEAKKRETWRQQQLSDMAVKLQAESKDEEDGLHAQINSEKQMVKDEEDRHKHKYQKDSTSMFELTLKLQEVRQREADEMVRFAKKTSDIEGKNEKESEESLRRKIKSAEQELEHLQNDALWHEHEVDKEIEETKTKTAKAAELEASLSRLEASDQHEVTSWELRAQQRVKGAKEDVEEMRQRSKDLDAKFKSEVESARAVGKNRANELRHRVSDGTFSDELENAIKQEQDAADLLEHKEAQLKKAKDFLAKEEIQSSDVKDRLLQLKKQRHF